MKLKKKMFNANVLWLNLCELHSTKDSFSPFFILFIVLWPHCTRICTTWSVQTYARPKHTHSHTHFHVTFVHHRKLGGLFIVVVAFVAVIIIMLRKSVCVCGPTNIHPSIQPLLLYTTLHGILCVHKTHIQSHSTHSLSLSLSLAHRRLYLKYSYKNWLKYEKDIYHFEIEYNKMQANGLSHILCLGQFEYFRFVTLCD